MSKTMDFMSEAKARHITSRGQGQRLDCHGQKSQHSEWSTNTKVFK